MADTAPVHSNPSAPIPLTHARINGVEQPCIQARLLHQYLQNPIGFLDWFRLKTETLGLVCHRHYELSVQALAGETAPQQNFLLTLPAATVLTASENSDRGQQLCRYLIAVASQQDGSAPVPTQVPSVTSQSTSVSITPKQVKRLQELSRKRRDHTGLPYQTVWTEFKHHFGIRRYQNLPRTQFEAACQFLRRASKYWPSVPTADTSQPRTQTHDAAPLPDPARQVVDDHSFRLACDSLPLLRVILRNYLFRYAERTRLHDPAYVGELLSPFKHAEACFDWVNSDC
ncbi:ORF6C domain-containing protein [Macromonas bipunctata]|uniref:ORF6C domain-containing protein n=1 Tax=Macromonas bipunctata TaxID=183670 RepID=UPI000C338133|nr:ORF6C domain-containing protein [Macromonas bipunctata]